LELLAGLDSARRAPVAHYTHDHKTFDGFVWPTRRRVYLHDADGVADQSFAPITLDVDHVARD
jgi:hypothetical protein